MFKFKKRINPELFTPLLEEPETSRDVVEQEEINMASMESDHSNMADGHKITPASRPQGNGSRFSGKMEKLLAERERIATARKRSGIFEFDSERAAKGNGEWRYYIISLIVPIIVFVFALVVLFSIIVSPILQGLNASSAKPGTGSTQSEQHDGHNHQHDSPGLTPTQTTKAFKENAKTVNGSLSPSVKKDGDDGGSSNSHHHGK